MLYVDEACRSFLCRIALTVVLIRAGIGVDLDAVKKTKSLICRLGVVPPIVEGVVIFALGTLILPMDLKMQLLFAIILAPTSPAVVIPTMLGFMKKGYGTLTGTSSAIIASSTIDNIICIVAYNVLVSVVFSSVLLRYEFSIQFTAAVLGVIIGIFGGFIFRIHPHIGSNNLHIVRAILLFSVCAALNFVSLAIEMSTMGVIATVLMSFTASNGWKKTMESKFYHEAEIFTFIWDYFAVQMLFSLIGFQFQLNQ
ncbi:unnamed protein product, partial [Enterobius vermicularis]|uniref:Na_H_Exchanger domain-containing protein n=1 Tax=Enterobius vermicularis TaxID=51028 RepID=A0A0N4V8G1_ENTVE